jgi:hypothetical protein
MSIHSVVATSKGVMVGTLKRALTAAVVMFAVAAKSIKKKIMSREPF